MATRLGGFSGTDFWCTKFDFTGLWILWRAIARDIVPSLVEPGCRMYGYYIDEDQAEDLAGRLAIAIDDGSAFRLHAGRETARPGVAVLTREQRTLLRALDNEFGANGADSELPREKELFTRFREFVAASRGFDIDF